MTLPPARALGRLIDEWRNAPEIRGLVAELEARLATCDEPFLGQPLPDALVGDRLPPGIASAWVFVLRANHRNPSHLHPNSTQYTAAIQGGGIAYFGAEAITLRAFDAADPEATIYTIPPGTGHAFSPGQDGLVVISFHTVAPEELVEIEMETAKSRTYISKPRTK